MALTHGAWAVRETSQPPGFDLPLADVKKALLHPAGRGSFSEWKSPVHYWDLMDNERRLPQVDCRCPHSWTGAEPLVDCIAFYAHHLDCTLDGVQVITQSGGF